VASGCELVRLLFADGADGAAHGLAASEGDLARPELRTWLCGAGDAFTSVLAGGVVVDETAHDGMGCGCGVVAACHSPHQLCW
jgi:hypothetical protein